MGHEQTLYLKFSCKKKTKQEVVIIFYQIAFEYFHKEARDEAFAASYALLRPNGILKDWISFEKNETAAAKARESIVNGFWTFFQNISDDKKTLSVYQYSFYSFEEEYHKFKMLYISFRYIEFVIGWHRNVFFNMECNSRISYKISFFEFRKLLELVVRSFVGQIIKLVLNYCPSVIRFSWNFICLC